MEHTKKSFADRLNGRTRTRLFNQEDREIAKQNGFVVAYTYYNSDSNEIVALDGAIRTDAVRSFEDMFFFQRYSNGDYFLIDDEDYGKFHGEETPNYLSYIERIDGILVDFFYKVDSNIDHERFDIMDRYKKNVYCKAIVFSLNDIKTEL